MKRFRIKQTAATPIFLFCMILCIQILSTKGSQQEKPREDASSVETMQQGQDKISNVPTQKAQPTQVMDDGKEDAEVALETGVNIAKEVTNEYAKDIIERVRNRKVVASDTKNLLRENGEDSFCQSFDWMSGYQNLVQFQATEPVEQSFEIHSEISDVVVVMIFPDQSYVEVKINEPVTLRVPSGRSTIIYVGEGISGSIEAKIEKNDKVTYHRM